MDQIVVKVENENVEAEREDEQVVDLEFVAQNDIKTENVVAFNTILDRMGFIKNKFGIVRPGTEELFPNSYFLFVHVMHGMATKMWKLTIWISKSNDRIFTVATRL